MDARPGQPAAALDMNQNGVPQCSLCGPGEGRSLARHGSEEQTRHNYFVARNGK